MIIHDNFKLLMKAVDIQLLKKMSFLKYASKGFMDLSVDLLEDLPNEKYRIALAHHFIQNGDVCANPDMEIIIDLREHTARALSYQQDNLGVYYRLDDNEECSTSFRKELNIFLGIWLSNILSQGYKLQAGYRDE